MKILFLIKSIQDQAHYNPFYKEASAMGVSLDVRLYHEICIKYVSNRQEILVGDTPLSEYNLVFFYTVFNFEEIQIIISQYCLKNKIPVVDRVFQHDQPWIDRKSFEYAILSQNKLPIIDSYFFSKKRWQLMVDKIDFPIVVKETDESQGRGVYLCQNVSEVSKLLKNSSKDFFIFQKYIKTNGDIRLFIIGKKVIGSIKRQSKNAKEFRNNISLGGRGTLFEPQKTVKEDALKAASLLQYDISGVDFIYDEVNRAWKILEVNRAPQFDGFMKVTGINIPKLILDYLKKSARPD